MHHILSIKIRERRTSFTLSTSFQYSEVFTHKLNTLILMKINCKDVVYNVEPEMRSSGLSERGTVYH